MLAREGKGAMGGLCPCAAGSAHGVRSQQGSEQPQGTCGWRITRCCCLLAPTGSDLGWDVRRGMQTWWVQRGTSVSSSVPTLGRGLGSCSLSGALSGKLERILSPGNTERVRTQDTGLVGSEHAWRHQEGWGGEITASSLLGSCMRLGQLGTAPSPC